MLETVADRELIGVGPNQQARADMIGKRLCSILEQQAEAMTEVLQLYRMYQYECRGRKLIAKKPAVDPFLGVRTGTEA